MSRKRFEDDKNILNNQYVKDCLWQHKPSELKELVSINYENPHWKALQKVTCLQSSFRLNHPSYLFQARAQVLLP
jgi:hypothetical protein